MRAGLDASTVTPGSTAPDESVTTPVMLAALVPCAATGGHTTVKTATANALMRAMRDIKVLLPATLKRAGATLVLQTSVNEGARGSGPMVGTDHTPSPPGCQPTALYASKPDRARGKCARIVPAGFLPRAVLPFECNEPLRTRSS